MTANAYTLNVMGPDTWRDACTFGTGATRAVCYRLRHPTHEPIWEELRAKELQARRTHTRWTAYAKARRHPVIRDHDQLQRFLWIAAEEYGWDARTETQFYLGAPSSRRWCVADLTLSRTDAWTEPQAVVELKVEIPNEWCFRRGVYQAVRYRVASYGLQTFLVAGGLADGLDLAWASRLNVSVLTVAQFLRWMSADERPALEAV